MPPPPPISRGNALFLILIAVALFAALSYAVTQSGRDGASADRESAALHAAQITQQASAISTTVQRMVLTGTNQSDLVFCSVNETSLCQTTAPADGLCETGADCVFAPEGGGALPPSGPDAAWTGSFFAPGTWHVYPAGANWTVSGLGSAASDAFLIAEDLTQGVCEAINKGLGLTLPVASDSNFMNTVIDAYPGEPFFCYRHQLGIFYSYVHVLLER